jgi:hypothetical protein
MPPDKANAGPQRPSSPFDFYGPSASLNDAIRFTCNPQVFYLHFESIMPSVEAANNQK